MPSLQGSPRRKSYLTGHESGTDFCSMFFLIQKKQSAAETGLSLQ